MGKVIKHLTDDEIFFYIKDCLEPTKDLGWSSDILFTDEDSYLWEDKLKNAIKDCRWVASGCTKLVFSLDGLADYVVKIPFYGKKWVNSWGEDDWDYFHKAGHDFMDNNAPNNFREMVTSVEGNYCELETNIYQYMKNNYPDIANCFCETRYLGEALKGVHVYISKRVDMDLQDEEGEFQSSSKTFVNSERKAKDDNHKINLNNYQKAMFIDSWGQEIAEELFSVIEKLGIPDLYTANLGVKIDEHKIYLIDYSGYGDAEWGCYSDIEEED